jgi:hypothetical protein
MPDFLRPAVTMALALTINSWRWWNRCRMKTDRWAKQWLSYIDGEEQRMAVLQQSH